MDAAASHIEKMNANPIYNGAQAYGTYYATFGVSRTTLRKNYVRKAFKTCFYVGKSFCLDHVIVESCTTAIQRLPY